MKRILGSAAFLLVGGAVLLFHHPSVGTHGAATGAIQNLAARCASSVDKTGFGQVSVTQNLNILNETGALNNNCTLHISNGATITIANSQLSTNHLIILDDTAGSEGVHLQISNSTMGGVDSGFYLHFQHFADTVSFQSATINYPRSVTVFIYGEGNGSDEGGGRITLQNTTVNSTDAASEGIRIAASEMGGVALFQNDKFNSPGLSGQALLFAGTCTTQLVKGAPASCAPQRSP